MMDPFFYMNVFITRFELKELFNYDFDRLAYNKSYNSSQPTVFTSNCINCNEFLFSILENLFKPKMGCIFRL